MSTSSISTIFSANAVSTSQHYCTTVILGSINKCYVIFQVFMVDWQFTVFCREVGFVEFYAFLVLFFLAKNVSLLFLLLFASLCLTYFVLGSVYYGGVWTASTHKAEMQKVIQIAEIQFWPKELAPKKCKF